MDTTWFRDVHAFEVSTPGLHTFFADYAKYGIALFGVLIVVGYLLARRAPDAQRRVAATLWTAVGALAALAIAQPIASAVSRARPFCGTHPVIPKGSILVAHACDTGFPSDHATAAGAVAVGMFFIGRWALGVVGTLLALLMAFSRVYVGVHYPGDVAGGLALGAVVVALGALLVVPLMMPAIRTIARTSLRPLVQGSTATATERPAP